MTDTPKWLWPAAIAGAIGLALWWIFEPDEAGATGLAKLKKAVAPPDPYAGLGQLACQGGVTYYGGIAAGMASAPLCKQVGEAAAPVTKSLVNTAGQVIGVYGDAIVDGYHGVKTGVQEVYGGGKTAVSDLYSGGKFIVQGAGSVVGNVLGGAKTVVGDAYAGGKTAVKDAYNTGKDVAGYATGITPAKKLASKIASWF